MPFDATPDRNPTGKKLRYEISLACNDPDTGNEIGQCRGVDVCCGALESDDRIYNRPLRLVETTSHIRLAGKHWPIKWMKYGVGNWCWNAYGMKAHVVVQFLIWLRRRQFFTSWEGQCELVDWMEGKRKMSPFEIRAQLDAWLIN